MRIGFVTPWFGENIPGGAEMELRGIASHLSEAGENVEILTTCVKEFLSDWNTDYYKQGEYKFNNIIIRRFKVRKRDVKAFDKVNYKLMNNMVISFEEEKIYIEEMINSPELYEYIRNHCDEYDVLVFIPYMFGTTYYGVQICPEKSVLIPCFHDESYIYLNIFKKAFENIKGMIFHARPEQELANRVFNLKSVSQGLLGGGVDSLYQGSADNFIEKYHINYPFILYAGRKDKGKNVDELIAYFTQYKQRNDTKLKLILIGGGKIQIAKSMKDEIIDLGFLPIQDKYDAYAAAEVLCQPSKNESFSLVIMESWLANRPVMVHEECAVTKNFAIESNGGLYFKDFFEFEGCLNFLLKNKEIADQMGDNGRRYVLDNFTWDVIVRKYVEFFRNEVAANARGAMDSGAIR